MPRKDGKPRGRMSSYAFFVQTCREEHKRKHPGESVVFAEFSRKCSEKWRSMTAKDKKRFDDMAEKDKQRFDSEMDSYQPTDGGRKRRRKTKDPNAPKRALSAFFWFCSEERPSVRAAYPSYTVGEVAKELGKRWEVCPNRSKFEAMAEKDKARYEKDMNDYRKGSFTPGKGSKAKVAKAAEPEEEEEEEEEEDEEEEEEEDDE